MIAWISAHSTLVMSILGVVVIPLFGYFLNHKVGKWTARAQSRGAEATAYDTAREIWGDLIDDLRSKVSDQRREIDAMRKRFDGEMQTLRIRLEDLESQRANDVKRINLLVEYAKALVRALKSNGIEPPPQPDGLHLDT